MQILFAFLPPHSITLMPPFLLPRPRPSSTCARNVWRHAEFSLCQTCHSQQRHGHLSTHLFLRLPRHLPQLVRRTSECSRPLLPLLFPQLTVDVYVP